MTSIEAASRLAMDPNVSETSPCIRGTWVTVAKIIDHIVDGWTWSDVLKMHPEITEDDIRAALAYTIEADPDPLPSVDDAPEPWTFDDAVRIARGCLDYGGGYRALDDSLAIFHHGIQTVINALEGAAKNGHKDTQVAALHRMGSVYDPQANGEA
jgi:uncharacterized protein (DUF433 family)